MKRDCPPAQRHSDSLTEVTSVGKQGTSGLTLVKKNVEVGCNANCQISGADHRANFSVGVLDWKENHLLAWSDW